MKFSGIYFLMALGLVSASANAANLTYGEYLANANVPSFEQFKVKEEKFTAANTLKLSKGGEGWTYRTRLKEAYNNQPNFAGKYVVTSIGCGSSCQTNFILDKENGKVVANIYSAFGVEFKTDSRLLVVNSPEGYEDTPLDEIASSAMFGLSYYELKNNKLVLIKEINKDSIEKSE